MGGFSVRWRERNVLVPPFFAKGAKKGWGTRAGRFLRELIVKEHEYRNDIVERIAQRCQ